MYIFSKKAETVRECNNMDVADQLKKDDGYLVAESMEELTRMLSGAPKEDAEPINEPEIQEEAEVEEADPIDEAEAEEAEEEITEKDLSKKSVDELRKIAKKEGIQGYANMNKATLVQMILNH